MTTEQPVRRRSSAMIGLAGAGVVLLVALFDWATGPEVSLSIFYLLPSTLVAWSAGRRLGVALGIWSALLWLLVELNWGRHYLNPVVPFVNALLQMGMTIAAVVMTSAVAERERRLQEEIATRRETEAKLNLLRENLELRVAERSASAEKRATELSRSEAVLRRQTSLLKSILTSMGDGVVVADETGLIRLYNSTAARLLQIGPAEPGRSEWSDEPRLSLSELLAAYPGSAPILAAALKGGSVDGLELCSRLSDYPEEIWLAMTTRKLIDDSGELQGVVFVFNDVTQRKRMERLVADVIEREQQRIGQDLHDGLGQHLVSTGFAIKMLRDRLAEQNLPEVAETDDIGELINSAISQTRNLARGLYPVKLEGEGLASALEELSENISRSSNVVCRFEAKGAPTIFDPMVGTNLYRLAQEALNNALRHGKAKHISIRLDQNNSAVILTVANDGSRYDAPPANHRGMGLHIMQYRARLIGAEFQIGPGFKDGTVVRCAVANLKGPDSLHDRD